MCLLRKEISSEWQIVDSNWFRNLENDVRQVRGMKPRVIIADTDESYIAPLQLKFAKEFHDKIVLEIITQHEYFSNLFSRPQKVQILVISRELYDSAMLHHSIDHIFLMQEQYDEVTEEDPRVTRLFKYSSIKEIFNEIVGKSAEVFHVSTTKKKETQIVMVTSVAGGVGTTTVAMGIAASLVQNYKKVLYINASGLQTFQYRLKNPSVLSMQEVYASLSNPQGFTYEDIGYVIRKETFSYFPAFKAALISLGLDAAVYRRIAIAAKASSEYDFIIIDAESTFDEEKINLIDMTDKIVMVIDQSVKSVVATNLFLANINGVDFERYIFVCNRFRSDTYNALVTQNSHLRFRVNEYIDEFAEEPECEELSKKVGIKKIAFSLM